MKTIHQMRPSHCGFEGSGSDCPKSIPFKGELPVTPSQSRDNPQDPLRTKCLTTKPRVSSTLASNSDPFDSHLSPSPFKTLIAFSNFTFSVRPSRPPLFHHGWSLESSTAYESRQHYRRICLLRLLYLLLPRHFFTLEYAGAKT